MSRRSEDTLHLRTPFVALNGTDITKKKPCKYCHHNLQVQTVCVRVFCCIYLWFSSLIYVEWMYSCRISFVASPKITNCHSTWKSYNGICLAQLECGPVCEIWNWRKIFIQWKCQSIFNTNHQTWQWIPIDARLISAQDHLRIYRPQESLSVLSMILHLTNICRSRPPNISLLIRVPPLFHVQPPANGNTENVQYEPNRTNIVVKRDAPEKDRESQPANRFRTDIWSIISMLKICNRKRKSVPNQR